LNLITEGVVILPTGEGTEYHSRLDHQSVRRNQSYYSAHMLAKTSNSGCHSRRNISTRE